MSLIDAGSFYQAAALGQASGTTPDTKAVRRIRNKGGASLNVEQAITEDLGFFLRAGLSDGSSSISACTDNDNTVSTGLSFAGKRSARDDDTVGIAVARNDITAHYPFIDNPAYHRDRCPVSFLSLSLHGLRATPCR